MLIAAQYSGAQVNIAYDFVFGETNKTEAFLKKFPLGKVGLPLILHIFILYLCYVFLDKPSGMFSIETLTDECFVLHCVRNYY